MGNYWIYVGGTTLQSRPGKRCESCEASRRSRKLGRESDLCFGGVGELGGRHQLALGRGVDHQDTVLPLLQEVSQHGHIVLLAHHLGPLVWFLREGRGRRRSLVVKSYYNISIKMF